MFEKAYNKANLIIENSNQHFVKNKRNNLNNNYSQMLKLNDPYYTDFYSIYHELVVFDYLSNLNLNPIAHNDNTAGPDFETDIGYVECIIATMGEQKDILIKTCNDYTDEFCDINDSWASKITYRFSTAVKEKNEKYNKYLSKNIIDENKPFIICISSLIFSSLINNEYCKIILQKILYCIGFVETVHIIQENNTYKFTDSTYNYDKKCEKIGLKSKSIIDTGYFDNDEFKNISAVILANEILSEDLDKDSFIIFLNPFAKNKLDVKSLKDFQVFTIDKEENGQIIFNYK